MGDAVVSEDCAFAGGATAGPSSSPLEIFPSVEMLGMKKYSPPVAWTKSQGIVRVCAGCVGSCPVHSRSRFEVTWFPMRGSRLRNLVNRKIWFHVPETYPVLGLGNVALFAQSCCKNLKPGSRVDWYATNKRPRSAMVELRAFSSSDTWRSDQHGDVTIIPRRTSSP